MKVLITGSTDLLGSSLLRLAPGNIKLSASYNVNTLVPNVTCDYHFMDITQEKLVMRVFDTCKPDIVIHTAAISSPEYCNKHKPEAIKVNVGGTRNVIHACQRYGTSLVFISSNGIYNGNNSPYDEQSTPDPLDTYGDTKYQGELLVEKSKVPYMIMRLMTMYGWNNPYERNNPATWLLEALGKDKMSVHVVNDLFNNFLFSEAAASIIWKAILLKKFGENFNIAGKECINRYEFSREVANIFGLDSAMIYEVSSKFFKNLVVRPKNTCFNTRKMHKTLGFEPMGIREGLEAMKKNKVTLSDWKKI